MTDDERAVLAKELAPRYEAGESLHRIGQSVGLSPSWVGKLLRGAGVQLRLPGWRGAGGGDGPTSEGSRRGHMLLGPQPEQFPPLLPPGPLMASAKRRALGKLLRAWYEAGADTELIGHAVGRNYVWAWRLLHEAGTVKRPRGVTIINPAVQALEDHIAARDADGE